MSVSEVLWVFHYRNPSHPNDNGVRACIQSTGRYNPMVDVMQRTGRIFLTTDHCYWTCEKTEDIHSTTRSIHFVHSSVWVWQGESPVVELIVLYNNVLPITVFPFPLSNPNCKSPWYDLPSPWGFTSITGCQSQRSGEECNQVDRSNVEVMAKGKWNEYLFTSERTEHIKS